MVWIRVLKNKNIFIQNIKLLHDFLNVKHHIYTRRSNSIVVIDQM